MDGKIWADITDGKQGRQVYRKINVRIKAPLKKVDADQTGNTELLLFVAPAAHVHPFIKRFVEIVIIP